MPEFILYLLLIAAFIFSIFTSINVKSTFRKYNKMPSSRGMSAATIARQILDSNGLYNVQITRVSGELTDHYDPRTNTVALSAPVYDSISVGAIGVAPLLRGVGIGLFAAIVLFQLITLPVEFNASYRALATIKNQGILFGAEYTGAKKTLTAAAMTYVASLAVALLQLLFGEMNENRKTDNARSAYPHGYAGGILKYNT